MITSAENAPLSTNVYICMQTTGTLSRLTVKQSERLVDSGVFVCAASCSAADLKAEQISLERAKQKGQSRT